MGQTCVYHESSLPRRHTQGLATSQATQWTVVTMHLNHCYKQSKSFPLRLVLLGSSCNHATSFIRLHLHITKKHDRPTGFGVFPKERKVDFLMVASHASRHQQHL